MENRKDCRHWEEVSTVRGTCKNLTRYQGGLVQTNGDGNVSTWNTFGCPLFKGKPKGPFTAEKRRGSICEVWDVDVHFPGHDSRWVSKGTQKQATELARFLNERWAERRE